MKGFWRVAQRELAAHRMLLVASALFGLFVAAMPWLSGTPRAAELRAAGALVGVSLWGLALAVSLGVRAVAAPLAARRLEFDFRQPLSPAAIWLGRLAAGALVVLVGAALTLLVPLPFGLDLAGAAGALDLFIESALPGHQAIDGLLVLAPLVLLTAFLLAHAAGVALAAERLWLAVAFVAVLAAKVGVWLAWRELGLWGASEARRLLLAGALAASVAGLAAASAVAAGLGRAELDRVGRSFGGGLAAAGVTIAAAALGYAAWFARPAASELVGGGIRPLNESWSIVQGRAPGRGRTTFTVLRTAEKGRELRLGPPPIDAGWWRHSVQLASDRSTLLWLERADPDSFAVDLLHLDLASESATPRRSPIRWAFQPPAWAVSPTGGEVASLRGGEREPVRLVREEVSSGDVVDVVALAPCRWADGPIRYTASDRIGLACSTWPGDGSESRHHVFEVDLATRTPRDLGEIQLHPLVQGSRRFLEAFERAP